MVMRTDHPLNLKDSRWAPQAAAIQKETAPNSGIQNVINNCTGLLQKRKQAGAGRRRERVPPAGDGQGGRDPAGAFSAPGPPPAGFSDEVR